MATCEMYAGAVGSVWKKSRSPGCSWETGTIGPVRAWSTATRGITTPACASDHCTSPEQSNARGPAAPQTYGRPILLSAAFRNLTASARVSPGPSDVTEPAAPAAPVLTATPEPVAVFTSASATTCRGRGISFSIWVTSVSSRACGALTTMALPAGRPSEWAVAPDTTASTPGMPTVPNPPTRSRSERRPTTLTVPPSGSLSRRPIVYEAATPPAATLRHSLLDTAVGRAAKPRNVDGSTPSIATYLPLTWILAASTDCAATTPGSFLTSAAAPGGSPVGATTSTSACSMRRSGATASARAPAERLATVTARDAERG